MQVEDALKSRHAVRDFTDQPVTKETIQEIVRLAQQTPSWVNSEPWRVYAATGQSLTQIRQGCLDLAAQKVATNPDLKTMSRDDWDARPQKLMKDWGHDLVHSFTDFDEAHTVMTGASDALNNAPAILFVTIPKQTPDWAIRRRGLHAKPLAGGDGQGVGVDSNLQQRPLPAGGPPSTGDPGNRAAPGRGRARLRKLGQGQCLSGPAPGPQ